MTDLAGQVVDAADSAVYALYERECRETEWSRWITPADREARLRALARAFSWVVTSSRVTVSADGTSEAARRLHGDLGGIAEFAAQKVLGAQGLEYWVTSISPFAYSINWK